MNMLNERTLEKYIFSCNPIEQVCSKEYIEGVLYFGSFLTILNSKKINASVLFTSILQNFEMRELFIHITGSQNTHEALLGLLQLYPNLLKSKNTKRLFNHSLKKKR